MAFFRVLNQFSKQRLSWALLLAFMIFFELCALGFQHIMMLSPCVNCIYERVAMLGIAGAAIIGLLAPQNGVLRWLGLAGWGYSAYRGLEISAQHVEYQFNPSPFASCDLWVTFPSWLPLDQWAPWMFVASGDCAEVDWIFLSLSMPQWLVIIFAANLIALAFIVLAQFFPSKRGNPIRSL
ncbi:disulfide bond formation protein DsbB [Vibrio sp. SM6]|uniref:Disulfide bond formation protein B n=1 Tax=Vibrio agarilyticus TaxID=2726741 RepID=A0A7X8TSM2_9VIBR|nr:disulfide bond formation protein DsbB [Vibrio agarilyticus]